MFLNLISDLKKQILLTTVKYIVWDFDGTLYEDNNLLGIQLKKAFLNFSKLKLPNLNQVTFDNYTRDLGSWSKAASYLTKIDEFQVLNLVDKKVNKYKYIEKNPKIVNFIESSTSKFHHLILSNSTSQEIISCLSTIGFNTTNSPTGPFEKIFSRDTTQILKPNSRLFDQIVKYTNSPKKHHLFIGDSVDHDIKPALEYGFKAIPIWELNNVFPALI